MNKALLLLRPATALFAALTLAACVSKQVVPARPAATGSVAPTLALEQFLAAANAAANNDPEGLRTMGRLFGTKDAPVANIDSPTLMEQRMYALALIVKHQAFEIQGEQVVPGRLNEAKRFLVELTFPDRKVVVPFTMVLSKGNRWLVEEFEATKITGR